MTRIAQVEFRRVTEDDVPMIHEWLHRPHVAEWWAPTPSLEEVRAEFVGDSRDDPPVRAYIASLSGEPIGFIQSYVASESGDGWWPDEKDPGVVGTDQYLADADRLNQGLGTAMVRAFIEKLFGDPAVTRIQTDPDPTNARAIRCYEKAGFRRVCEVDTPDGRALLMYCDRPA
jgi:RimJ/RimL family protein N-acetyltransferase